MGLGALGFGVWDFGLRVSGLFVAGFWRYTGCGGSELPNLSLTLTEPPEPQRPSPRVFVEALSLSQLPYWGSYRISGHSLLW